MKTVHGKALKEQVKADRLTGMGINLLAQKYQISRTTIYYWIKNLKLSPAARLTLKSNSNMGREKGRVTSKRQREIKIAAIKESVEQTLSQIVLNQVTAKLLCACLFWGEGSKDLSSVAFTNSDPYMIKSFLILMRKAFPIDEKKLSALIHLHEYHNSRELHKFWSEVTQIPLAQFNKAYLKPNTGINIKPDYKGCICIKYFDAQIAKELYWLYTTLHQKLILSAF